jgi:cyclase
VPSERTVFTGDLLFAGAHPVVWASVRNWIGVCDRILAMDIDVVVPGHGPISDKSRVAEEKGYFEYLTREARKRYDAGMSPMDAARDISLEDYSTWGEAERVVVNIVQLYREFSGDTEAPDSLTLFSQMAEMSEP